MGQALRSWGVLPQPLSLYFHPHEAAYGNIAMQPCNIGWHVDGQRRDADTISDSNRGCAFAAARRELFSFVEIHARRLIS